MTLNPDAVPASLDEAVALLHAALTDEEKAQIKALESHAALHFSLGMAIRNAWSLWDNRTRLAQWFVKHCKLWQADDFSGLILERLYCELKDQPFDLKASVDRYHEHWKSLGVDVAAEWWKALEACQQ